MKIKYKKIDYDKLFIQVSKDISDGKIIGWFQNSGENGPRALGNRSILADPRREDIKDYLNEEVKHREFWRPYAPVVMEDYYKDWFLWEKESPYMLFSAEVKKPELVPGITHVDGSSRVQTVNEKQYNKLYQLLDNFYKITNVPMLLNTSFNDNGEPIVETPKDALNTFMNIKLDILVMNNFYIKKG